MPKYKKTINDVLEAKNKKYVEKIKTTISISESIWSIEDIRFWRDFGITLETLNKYNVVPINKFTINGRIYTADNYAYAFKEFKDNKTTYKIYQPFSIYNMKWRSSNNSSIWHGWTQLPKKEEVLIITKSLKDVMAIVSNTDFAAISLQSETTIPKEHIMLELEKRFNNIVLLYDNDFKKFSNVGQIQAIKILDKYDTIPSLYNIKIDQKYDSKDISDFIQNWGINYAIKELDNLVHGDKFMPF